MQDQVEALERVAPGRAAMVNAQQDAAANREALDARPPRVELRLLYVAPERFSSPGFLEALKARSVGLFVVDEAHCVSQWGHDFRPDYFRLADAARWLGAQAIVASTATATPQVAADIVRAPGAARPRAGHDRLRPAEPVASPSCAARRRPTSTARIAGALAEPEARARRSSTPARARSTEGLADALERALGVRGAGLPRRPRARGARRRRSGASWTARSRSSWPPTRSAWASTRPTCGPSRTPRCRGSVEAYYQEAGRAGRDGLPSRALLFAESRDKGLHVFFIQRAEVDDAALEAVARHAAARRGRRPLRPAGVGRRRSGARARARRSSAISRGRASCARRRRRSIGCAGASLGAFDGRARATCRSSAGDAQRARWRQYRAVWAFVEGAECRRAAILRHFGDRAQPHRRGAVLRRLRARARARAAARAAGRRRRPAARAISMRPSSTWSPAPSRRSGARARSRSCAAGARRSCARTPTTVCPPTGRSPTCARTRCWRASTSCSTRGAWSPPAAPTRSCRLGQAA